MGGPLPRVRRSAALARAPAWALPVACLAAGIVLRAAAIVRLPVASDAGEYTALAASLLEGDGMWLPFGEYWEIEAWVPGPSHHYPPVYPLYLVPFLAALGPGTIVPGLAAFVAGIALLVVYYRAGASLFGRESSLWCVGMLALDPVLVATTGTGYSENLVALLFVVTVAGILKSLERPRWILVAGLAAGLAYLTKSSVGPFFVIAGVAGFAWRFHFERWGVLRDRAYLGAIALFAVFAGGWAARNASLFWDGDPAHLWRAAQSSEWFTHAAEVALANPGDLAYILAARVPFFAALFLLVAGPWWREIRSLPFRSDPAASGLGLSVGLTYVLAWLISGVLWVVERSPVFWADMSRYVVIANPAVWWMAAKGGDPSSGSFRRRAGAAAAILLAMNAAAFLAPQGGVFEAYGTLRERAHEGDTVALDRVPKYEAMIHLAGTGVNLEPYGEAADAEYVLTTNVTRSYDGYEIVDVYGDTNGTAVLPSFQAALWVRSDAVPPPDESREVARRAGSEI